MKLLCGFRVEADRKKDEDIWTDSDGQKTNHQAKYGDARE